MFTFRMASYDDFLNETEIMRQMHFLEVVAHREGAQLALDDEAYRNMEEQEALRVILAYVEDEIAGYIINAVHGDMFNTARLQATLVMIFAHPNYRASGLGLTLYKMAELDLKAIVPGAIWRTSVPTDGGFKGRQRTGIERFGFTPIERLYEKVI